MDQEEQQHLKYLEEQRQRGLEEQRRRDEEEMVRRDERKKSEMEAQMMRNRMAELETENQMLRREQKEFLEAIKREGIDEVWRQKSRIDADSGSRYNTPEEFLPVHDVEEPKPRQELQATEWEPPVDETSLGARLGSMGEREPGQARHPDEGTECGGTNVADILKGMVKLMEGNADDAVSDP